MTATSDKRRYYVAGPMTGIPKFNVPVFDRQVRRLRAAGYTAVSPTELDDPEQQALLLGSKDGLSAYAKGETWADFLSRDVKVIADCVDAIVVLPGWHRSKGARLEVFVGLLSGKPIYEDLHLFESGGDDQPDGPQVHLAPIHKHDIVFAIARSFIP